MSKTKITRIIVALVLVLALAGGGIVYHNVAVKDGGSVTDQAGRRAEGEPADGIVYIEPEMVSLANSLSGTDASRAAAKAAFDIVNAKRQSAGLSALTWDSGIEQAAAVRAVEASQVWSHSRPDGSEYWTVNSNLIYGENLAKGYATADGAVQGWMDSVTHKDNILFPDFATGAIVVHVGSDGTWYWAQEFGY